MVAVLDPGTTRRRRLHPLADAGRAGRLVPRAACRAARRARSSSIPAMPTSSPAAPGAPSVEDDGEGRGEAARLRPARGLSSPRPASSASRCRPTRSSAALPRRRRGAVAPTAGPRRRGDHDHRHLPQGRDASARRSTASPVTINGFAKGSGMIAPDMATMLAYRLHRRGDPGRGAAGAAHRRATSARSTRSPSTATPRPATRCCCAPPARRSTSA